MLYRKKYILWLLLPACWLYIGCSTQKNTAGSRRWHAFMARYNTYYNGTLAYIDGQLAKEQGNQDNFTELIPLYTVGNKASRELGKSNFDRAIEKSEKAIKLHSITRRPQWTKNRKKTPEDLEWLNRREYNPFIWRAWMLMGRAQFYQGKFEDAASTFSYMSRLYRTQPAIYAKARAWLAKSYVEAGWLYDAEDVIRNMRRDSIPQQAQKEWDYTLADYHIRSGEYAQAIPYLRRVIKHEMRRKQKAREWFLLGQLYEAVGQKEEAYKAYRHVVRLAPPYFLDFNARIAMTNVLSGKEWGKMIGRLRRMAANDNNKEYLDQVYYAIGNIYLAQKDTVLAIASYEKGREKAMRSGIEKGVLLLKLGNLYWQQEQYGKARTCYGEAIGLLDKERKDYEELSYRSKVLDELVPYTDAIQLQDSLQRLAQMDEKSRNAAIDRVIDALKKKEKEERAKEAEAQAEKNRGNTGFQSPTTRKPPVMSGQNGGTWYFYNPLTVSQGKAQFEKLWGKRQNVDDWQRVNTTVVAGMGGEQAAMPSDSMPAANEEEAAQVADSAENDPHERAYYLKQIPFTAEQMAASNAIIMDGLYHSGVIFKDKLDNLTLSRKAFDRLLRQYPDYEGMADVYYHLYLLNHRAGMPAEGDRYVEKLKAEYPESEWTKMLSDPYYAENARLGKQLEDSLYAHTYDAFKSGRYAEVLRNVDMSGMRFPMGENRDKFLFIGGLTRLNNGDAAGCVRDMEELVRNFPKSKMGEMAGMLLNGVKSGRRLHSGSFALENVWSRRAAVLADSDSIANRKLSAERYTDFNVLLVYHPDSLDENQLLFRLAKHNFTSFLVRNFDMEAQKESDLHRLVVKGFRSFDEALQYARSVYGAVGMGGLLKHVRMVVISQTNLPLLGTQYSYDEYAKYYDKHFAPLKVSTMRLLTEPEDIVVRPEKELTPEDVDRVLEDGIYLDEIHAVPIEQGTVIELPKDEKPTQKGGEILIPQVEEKASQQEERPLQRNEYPIELPTVPEERKEEIVVPEQKPQVPQQEEKKAVLPKEEIVIVPEKAQDDKQKKAQPTEQPKQPAKEKQPEYELEDEYYDLGGF